MKALFKFKDLGWDEIREFFSYDAPNISEIRKRYDGRFIDLNKETHLDKKTFASALVEAAKTNSALYVPEDFEFWDKSKIFYKEIGGEKIALEINTPYRFRKFGPEININNTKMTVEEARRTKFHEAIYKSLSDTESRKSMLEGTRGMGWWRPRQKDHVIVPWHVLAEGFIYANQPKLGGTSKILYVSGDARIKVPSTSSRRKLYDIYILTLPATSIERERNLDMFQTSWKGDACEDVIYREMGWKFPDEKPEILSIIKYSRPEQVICKHSYTAEWKACEQLEKNGLSAEFRYPYPQRLFGNVYNTLKRKTIIGDEKHGKRPAKSMIAPACGMAIGLEGPDQMFIFDL